MAFEIKSSAFSQGESIPRNFTCEGADDSVPLSWSGAPSGTKSFALVADDPDAPSGTWVHWVVYNIPPTRRVLEGKIPKFEELPDGTFQGRNDFGQIGYGGPCPPPGASHRYFFRLYAVDRVIPYGPGRIRKDVMDALEDHILGEASLMGKYQR